MRIGVLPRGWTLRFGIRVLSPSIEPWVLVLEGSTARTARSWPFARTKEPNASMKEDLPTPWYLEKEERYRSAG
jgi:hypothetical protein